MCGMRWRGGRGGGGPYFDLMAFFTSLLDTSNAFLQATTRHVTYHGRTAAQQGREHNTYLLQYNDDEPLFSRPCCIRAACTADTKGGG